MASFHGALSLAKHSALIALALLLLLTPACNALCRAQACDASQSAPDRSACHESGMKMAADAAGAVLHSVRDCNLRELPAAVFAESRSKTIAVTLVEQSGHSAALAIALQTQPVASGETAVSLCSRSQSPHTRSASAPSVLRI